MSIFCGVFLHSLYYFCFWCMVVVYVVDKGGRRVGCFWMIWSFVMGSVSAYGCVASRVADVARERAGGVFGGSLLGEFGDVLDDGVLVEAVGRIGVPTVGGVLGRVRRVFFGSAGVGRWLCDVGGFCGEYVRVYGLMVGAGSEGERVRCLGLLVGLLRDLLVSCVFSGERFVVLRVMLGQSFRYHVGGSVFGGGSLWELVFLVRHGSWGGVGVGRYVGWDCWL